MCQIHHLELKSCSFVGATVDQASLGVCQKIDAAPVANGAVTHLVSRLTTVDKFFDILVHLSRRYHVAQK